MRSTQSSDEWLSRLSRRQLDQLGPALEMIAAINDLEPGLSAAADIELRRRVERLRGRIRAGASPDSELVECFGLVRELASRVLGQRPYDVQLLAGIGLHQGRMIQMQTGEGKTLAAVAPVALNALLGSGVHVLTYNDYLAQRDAEWMGPVYERLGLSVGWVADGLDADQRRRAYSCDITYLTVKEAGFDLLRDGLCLEPEDRVQRGSHLAVVDEADSILIDEARVPLVIAGKLASAEHGLGRLADMASAMSRGKDFDTDECSRNVFLTDQGIAKAERLLECENLFLAENAHLQAQLRNALHAHWLLRRDVDYLIRRGRVELVDELTGRVAEQRQWPDGLQAAIEAKEGLEVQPDGQVLATISVQHLIKQYPRLAGMTATAEAAADELHEVYELEVLRVPTYRPSRRVDLPDLLFPGRRSKHEALIEEIRKTHSTGRPVLAGTISVEESEALAASLAAVGVPCRVLNARNDCEEAEIIAEAGAPGAVTISTNMAGRGTDIRLGGADEQLREDVVALGGLYVIGTNRHESRRIDDQLRGRAGRQGDPGASRFFVSLDDELPRRYGIESLLPARMLRKKNEPSTDEIEPERLDLKDLPAVQREIERIQRIVEGQNGDIRRRLMRYARPLERQREAVQEWRRQVLEGEDDGGLLAERCTARWLAAAEICGRRERQRIERKITLLAIDRCWSRHLAEMQAERDEIHLVLIDGRDPLTELYRRAGQAQERLAAGIEDTIVDIFNRVELTPQGVDWELEGLRGPSSTWTYLVNDTDLLGNTFMTLANRPSIGVWAVMLWGPLLFLWGAWLHLRRWRGRRQLSRASG